MVFGRYARLLGVCGTAWALATAGLPAQAQDSGDEMRIRKLESEVRALQRKVFPGGDGRYFEPEITSQPATAKPAANAPTTTAVTDILARMDAMESQVQRLTAQTEENANALRVLSDRFDAFESAAKANAAPQPSSDPASTAPVSRPAASGSAARLTPASAQPTVTGPSAERLAAVQAIAKPQTDDAGDDEYSYGYRLWDAGFYPEAQQQLTMFVEKYPSHWRLSHGRNLLGRAYLDDGKAREAAPWFLKNYQSDKNGERAGDSLLYLAETMIALNDTKRACIALAEFGETFPALASGRLQSQYAADRTKAKCN